ncbi:hypothetical protein P154DRAFT_564495 [Amniculicola lignicola CBS 123094]|uniref:Uncharacterized protein n=1 Tax=Amniculicola lignicola CBS 123094 TaxID=1392246 RepID=A0A6A5WCV7_9PLEO|nr:hypothetical protein P154DRAFT_564495 [Amniculicola lignicola CBS 123094]
MSDAATPVVAARMQMLAELFKIMPNWMMGPTIQKFDAWSPEEFRTSIPYLTEDEAIRSYYHDLSYRASLYRLDVYKDIVGTDWLSLIRERDSCLYNALLLRNTCSWAAYSCKDLITPILGNHVAEVKWLQVIPNPALVTFLFGIGEKKQIRGYRHDILMVKTHDGPRYAFDPTGAQFGQNQSVMEWEEYIRDHTLEGFVPEVADHAMMSAGITMMRPREARATELLHQAYHHYRQTSGVSDASLLSNDEFATHFGRFTAFFEKVIEEANTRRLLTSYIPCPGLNNRVLRDCTT